MPSHALTATDLKPLSDRQLLVLGARFALRVARWCPAGGEAEWGAAMADLSRACGGERLSASLVGRRKRALLKHGALGSYVGVPEPEWRSRSQAASALCCALEATQLGARPDRWRAVVQAGKHVGSVFAIQAHAGRCPLGEALTLPWAAARADLTQIVSRGSVDSLDAILQLGSLWPDGEPAWAAPAERTGV